MVIPLEPQDLFGIKSSHLLVDVRSPAEYAQGHIPGAVSIPLFSDEERAVVGTRYHQAGKEAALLVGLDLVGTKMSGFLKKLNALNRGGEKVVAVYCWRGGMRSASVAWLFELGGYRVYLLRGGYKTYRTYIRKESGNGLKMLVIGGMTGSGKTEVLMHLREIGEQTIDLESLACNKGSVFGYLGQGPQPGNEQFENDLFDELAGLDASRPVWLEDESRSIGAIGLPSEFYLRMKRSPLILLKVPETIRVERLVQEYAGFGKQELTDALEKLLQPLGGLNFREAVNHIEAGDFGQAIRIVLGYYDKMYFKALLKATDRPVVEVNSETGDAATNARLIVKLAPESFDKHKQLQDSGPGSENTSINL